MNRLSMSDVRQTFLSASFGQGQGRQECLPHGFMVRTRQRRVDGVLLASAATYLLAAAFAFAADGILVEHDAPVPMRDGVVLRADVFRPAEGGPFPVLVMRTPYNKEGKKFDAYVKAGYIVVCQDARGRYKSDGQYESLVRPQTHDAEDGYDTVEWAAKLHGSNGKAGTFGVSYNAFLQWRLAPLRPSSLVAMAASSIPARMTDLEGPGTIRPGRRLQWFYRTISPDLWKRENRPGPQTTKDAAKVWDDGEGERLLHFLPWLKLPDCVFETETEAMRAWLRHPANDPWQLDARCGDIAVPNQNVTGWFDHCNATILLTRAMVAHGRTEAARKGQRLIIGPWGHSTLGKRKIGDLDFGPAAARDTAQAEVRWFDYWLKGRPNGVDKDAPVKIFVMGANRWRDEAEWPLKRAKPTTFFLASGGKAHTPAGDGRLVAKASASAGTDHYRYDPRDPVPTQWTKAMFTVPADQRPLASRRDILVYQTEPLQQPLEVTGHAEVTLHAASSAPDTDFFARLIDVAPDGVARDVAMGMVRARYRRGLDKPMLLKPGEVTRFTIRLGPTSNEFQPGHRIRLDITSSDFPNYDRNHNTAADQNADAELAVAEQTVHHGRRWASKLVLPVIPKVEP
ncbi:MAG: CocE/NonD family hydrolase [Verrucomicrobia bacterium]|nr:CocE/NonD family hydrolase [Verrucomicrobiota bacterium]